MGEEAEMVDADALPTLTPSTAGTKADEVSEASKADATDGGAKQNEIEDEPKKDSEGDIVLPDKPDEPKVSGAEPSEALSETVPGAEGKKESTEGAG